MLTLEFQILLGLRSASEKTRGVSRELPASSDAAVTYVNLSALPSAAPLLEPSALCPLLSAGTEGQPVSEGDLWGLGAIFWELWTYRIVVYPK